MTVQEKHQNKNWSFYKKAEGKKVWAFRSTNTEGLWKVVSVDGGGYMGVHDGLTTISYELRTKGRPVVQFRRMRDLEVATEVSKTGKNALGKLNEMVAWVRPENFHY